MFEPSVVLGSLLGGFQTLVHAQESLVAPARYQPAHSPGSETGGRCDPGRTRCLYWLDPKSRLLDGPNEMERALGNVVGAGVRVRARGLKRRGSARIRARSSPPWWSAPLWSAL